MEKCPEPSNKFKVLILFKVIGNNIYLKYAPYKKNFDRY